MFLFLFWLRTNLRSHVAFGCHISLFPFNVEQVLSLSLSFLTLTVSKGLRFLTGFFQCFIIPALRPYILTGSPQKRGWAVLSASHRGLMVCPPSYHCDGSSIVYLVKVVSTRLFYCKLTLFPFVADRDFVGRYSKARGLFLIKPVPSLQICWYLYQQPLWWLLNSDRWFPSFLLHLFVDILWERRATSSDLLVCLSIYLSTSLHQHFQLQFVTAELFLSFPGPYLYICSPTVKNLAPVILSIFPSPFTPSPIHKLPRMPALDRRWQKL